MHSAAFRNRRFWNWFPLGLTYAFLYMGRYNLTVAKGALGELMTKEDFGIIFGAGTVTYAVSFLVNGPFVDRFGGRRGMLLAAFGTMAANLAMGWLLLEELAGRGLGWSIRVTFSVLYSLNMYFQSFGAVSIVKVNAHWFHVSERGGFSGIFGTMISSGVFFAFTVNGWILGVASDHIAGPSQWVVFFAPAVLLFVMGLVELVTLRDRPAQAGFEDFNTGDASSDDTTEAPIPARETFKRLLSNPIILTVAGIEFCTGVLRNGVMHWFPFYAADVWALPRDHALRDGGWKHWTVVVGVFVVAAVSIFIATRTKSGPRRGTLYVLGALAFLAPFLQGGWGGLLMVAGVIGANVAGWVSDLFFHSRRGPSVTMLYALMALSVLGMALVLAPSTSEVDWAAEDSGLRAGDRIVSVAGRSVDGWAEVASAVSCVPATCEGSGWDAETCICSTAVDHDSSFSPRGTIAVVVVRDDQEMNLSIPDPKPTMRAGDTRRLAARPVLPMSPFWLAAMVFFISLSVFGSHGLLSGTATMDFGGRKSAATAVGVIDGFVYLGTAVQSFALGWITTRDWSYWPWFLLPFAVVGTILCARIWHAHPDATRKGKKAS